MVLNVMEKGKKTGIFGYYQKYENYILRYAGNKFRDSEEMAIFLSEVQHRFEVEEKKFVNGGGKRGGKSYGFISFKFLLQMLIWARDDTYRKRYRISDRSFNVNQKDILDWKLLDSALSSNGIKVKPPHYLHVRNFMLPYYNDGSELDLHLAKTYGKIRFNEKSISKNAIKNGFNEELLRNFEFYEEDLFPETVLGVEENNAIDMMYKNMTVTNIKRCNRLLLDISLPENILKRLNPEKLRHGTPAPPPSGVDIRDLPPDVAVALKEYCDQLGEIELIIAEQCIACNVKTKEIRERIKDQTGKNISRDEIEQLVYRIGGEIVDIIRS